MSFELLWSTNLKGLKFIDFFVDGKDSYLCWGNKRPTFNGMKLLRFYVQIDENYEWGRKMNTVIANHFDISGCDY